jgi:hypothetical protein
MARRCKIFVASSREYNLFAANATPHKCAIWEVLDCNAGLQITARVPSMTLCPVVVSQQQCEQPTSDPRGK